METLFIQFYTKRIMNPKCYELGNGFSDTYDICKNNGDFHWVEHDYDNVVFIDLSIDKGTVYISCLYISHLYQAYIWANHYPEINFIIGGPVTGTYSLNHKLPSNMLITKKSVEEWFNVKNFSIKWNLNVPSIIPKDETIYFTYVLNNACYWNKCIFCSYIKTNYKSRIRNNFNLEYEKNYHDGKKIIRLGTEAILPNHIKNILPTLTSNNNIESYRVFLRATIQEFLSFKTIEDMTKINNLVNFNIGLEYPTQHMWDYMKKGYKTNVVLDLLNLIQNNFSISIILGWNNLTEQDLIDLTYFMENLPEGKENTISVYNLLALPETDIYKEYKVNNHIEIGPFYVGFYPYLNKRQQELNILSKDIILKYAKQKKYNTKVTDRFGLLKENLN